MDGPTLHEKLIQEKASLTAGTRMVLAAHIANALAFLEGYRIAHLDLSPANIVFHNSIPRLIDFGEAYSPQTARQYLARMERLHVPGRTFPYAPPETTLRH
jgi:serine/threonine protein kinase